MKISLFEYNLVWKIFFCSLLVLLIFSFSAGIRAQELPDDPYERALVLYHQGKYNEASEVLAMLLETEPEKIEAIYWRGLCHLKMNEIEAAREDFNRILEIKSGSALGLTGVALLLMQEKNYAEALNKVNEALKQEPLLAEAHYVKGLILSYQQKVDEAIKSLARAVEIAPKHAYGHYYLGLAYNQKKRKDLTIVHLEKFLTQAPQAPEAAQVRTLLNFLRR